MIAGKCVINYSVYCKICKGNNHSGVGSTEMVFGKFIAVQSNIGFTSLLCKR